jgi:glutamyl-tRNA synthetase
MLSYYYARKYEGKFILRIEDTDPSKIKKEYAEWIQEDLKKCGIDWDLLVYQSDRMDIYYEHAEKLLKLGRAYVCECPAEDFKKFKLKSFECPCRSLKIEEHLKRWGKMLRGGYEEGQAAVRLKTSMSNPNPVLRDPPILRINKQEHPMKGNKYFVWPLYNFSCAIDDHFLGVTHVFRGKEHEHNTAVQKIIYDIFGWKMPVVINFGMIRFPEGKIHTRDVKKMIAEGKISGWDDPRLPTIRALLRRGFQPEAFKQCAISCGLSKNDILLSWENLEGYNRKIIDSIANRYMVVINPVKIQIEGGPKIKNVSEYLHPDFPQRGKRDIPVNKDAIYISKEDFEKLKNKEIRLIGLFNIKLDKKSTYTGNKIIKEMQKIQWVSEPCVRVKIVKPDCTLNGFGEKSMELLKINDIIQMERVGFGRVDEKGIGKITIYFAHK